MNLLCVKTAAGSACDGGLQQPPSAGSTPSPSAASTCCWGMPSDVMTSGVPHTPLQHAWNTSEPHVLQAAAGPAGTATCAGELHRSLRVTLPDGGAAAVAQAPPSARRVLGISGDHGSVASWLDAQVGKRQGCQGALLSVRSHTNPALLDPADIATPSTAGSCASNASAEDLPAPAFQLLGLL